MRVHVVGVRRVKCAVLSGLCRGHAFRAVVRSALVTAGHFDSGDTEI